MCDFLHLLGWLRHPCTPSPPTAILVSGQDPDHSRASDSTDASQSTVSSGQQLTEPAPPADEEPMGRLLPCPWQPLSVSTAAPQLEWLPPRQWPQRGPSLERIWGVRAALGSAWGESTTQPGSSLKERERSIKPGQASDRPYCRRSGPPSRGLQNVRSAVVGLDETGQRTAFSQRRDVPGRADFLEHRPRLSACRKPPDATRPPSPSTDSIRTAAFDAAVIPDRPRCAPCLNVQARARRIHGRKCKAISGGTVSMTSETIKPASIPGRRTVMAAAACGGTRRRADRVRVGGRLLDLDLVRIRGRMATRAATRPPRPAAAARVVATARAARR